MEASDVQQPVAVGITAFGAIALMYKVWRLLKSDRRADQATSFADSLREELRQEIKSLKEEVTSLHNRCDQFAKERNDAVSRAALLEERVAHLTEQVEELKAERNELKTEHEVCRALYATVQRENAGLKSQVENLSQTMMGLPAGADAVFNRA